MKASRFKWIWVALLVASIVLIIIGLSRGEKDTVFIKAINICLECIGIG